jgi:hypothetical protein
VLNHAEAEISATEMLRERLAIAESMGTLGLRYNYAATCRDEDRYLAVLAHHAPETAELDSEPAAVLTKRVRTYTVEHEPPARIADPANADVARWRDIVTQHLPDAPVTADEWGIVRRHRCWRSHGGIGRRHRPR